AVQALVVGRGPGPASRADAAAALVPAQPLRLRLLGAADDRGAVDRLGPPPGASAGFRRRRAAHRGAPRARAPHARRKDVVGAQPPAPRLRPPSPALAAPPGPRARGALRGP